MRAARAATKHDIPGDDRDSRSFDEVDGDGDFDGGLRPGGEHRLLGDGCPENHAKSSRAGGGKGDKRRNVMTRMKLKKTNGVLGW